MPTKPIPDGYHTATPYLIIDGWRPSNHFYQRATGATELMPSTAPAAAFVTLRSRSVIRES